MATLGGSVKTLFDWGKELDPNGKVAKTIEILSQSNEILTDMMFKEGNLPTGERTSIRTGLPPSYWRQINQGVPSSKSTSAQVDENCGQLVAYSEVDAELARLNGNVNQYRLNEASAFLESMNQEMAQTLFYGSASNPEEFVGFAERYNDTTASNGQNIISAGGSGSDNSSVWLVGWGMNSVMGIFPKGSKAGIDHQDMGEVTLETTAGVAGNRMQAYRDYWNWKNGLVVKDWRYVARVANIDISDLVGQTSTQALTASTSLTKVMSRAIDRLPSLSNVKPVFYANRTVLSHLRIIAQEKSSSAVTIEPATNQFGQTIFDTKFLGIPVRLVDQLTETEATVS